MPDATPPSELTTRKRRKRDLLELCVGVGLILVVIWAPRRRQRYAIIAVAVWLPIVLWNSFEGWKQTGLHFRNFLKSLWVVCLALLFSGTAIAVADNYKTLTLPEDPVEFIERYGGYTLWSFAQQFLLLNFSLRRLLRLLPGAEWIAATIAALLFALAHLPNLFLAPVTFLWGLAACLLFLRYGNLYSLALAHAIFGIGLAVTVPAAISHRMLVGAEYYDDPASLPPTTPNPNIPNPNIITPQLPPPTPAPEIAANPTPDLI